MVLTDDTLGARLIASWRSRALELRNLLETDPTNSSAWLWTIQLRICRYLLRRYGRGPTGDASRRSFVEHAPPAPRAQDAPPTAEALPDDARELRERFRRQCHDTLARIQPLVADARDRSLQAAEEQIRRALRRRCRRRCGHRRTHARRAMQPPAQRPHRG